MLFDTNAYGKRVTAALQPYKAKKNVSTLLSGAARFMKERCFLKGFQASPVGPYGKSSE